MAKKKKKKQNIFEKALDSVSNAFKPNKSSSSKPVATQAYTRASEKPVKKDTTPKKTETKKTSKPVAVQSYTRASERGTPTYNNTSTKKKVENKGIQTRRTTNVDSRTKTNTSKQTQDQHYMTRRNTNVDSRTGKNTARHGEWTPNEKGKATNVEVGAKNVQQAMAVLEQNKDYLKSTGQYDAMRNKILMAAKRNTAGDAGLQMIRHSGFTEKEQKKLKANHDLKAFEAAPGSTAADKKLSVALTNAAKTVASGVEGATSGVFNAVTTVADSLERHIEGDKDKQQSQIDRLVSGKLTKTEEEMGLGKYKGNRKAAEQYVKNQDKKNKQNTKTATQMSDKYLEKAAADMQTAKDEADTKVGSFLTDVAIQGAKMGTETLLGGGAAGRMAVMASEVFGQGVKEARDGGGTEAQQLAYGLTSAAIEYLSEQVFGVAGKVFGKGYADDIVENLAGRITSKFGRNATRYVLGAIGEGLEEGFSDIATPFAQMIYNGKSKKETKKDLLSKESLTDMLYDMALGTAMGAFGATTQAFNGNFAVQDQELMNEIQSHRITDAKGNKIDRLEFAAQKMEQAQKKGQPISAKQIEKEWRKAYFAELTKNKTEIKKRMKNGLTRDEALAEMDEGVKWSDSEAYVSKWANRLTTNGVKTKEAVNADRVISRLIDAKGDSKAVSDAELKQVLNDLNITWYTNGKPRSKSGENSLAALRDRLGLDKVTVAGESWEYGPTQENRDYTVDQSHLIAAIRQGARAVGESKAQIVEDAAEDIDLMTNQAKAGQQAIDDLKNRRIVVGDLGEQTFDQFSEQFKAQFPDATDDQLMTAWSKAVEQNGVPEQKAADAFKPYEGEQTDMFPQMDNADYNDFVEEQRYLNPDITDEEIRKMWDERTEEQKQVRKEEREARDAGQLDMFDQMADESVRRQTLGLEPEEGRAAELKQSIKAIDDELSRYDNTETPEGIYVNKETGEEVPEETIERLKQNKEQLRTELMDIEPDEATTRERVFGIKQEEPVNEVEEIHEKAEIQKNAVLTDNEVAQRLERGTRDDLNTLAGNIGYRIELSDHLVPEDADMSLDVGVNGWIDKKNRVIKLALDATDDIETLRSRVLKVVAIHETTHGLETLAPEEYKSYADYVENNWDTLNDGEDYATALENKLKQYRDAGKDIDENGARQELMAEFASHMDQDAIFNFVNSNPTVGQKIVQMFRDIVARLREAFGHAGDMETALRKWEKAYQAAVKGTANVNNKTQVEEAYRAGVEVQDENGEPVAIMSEDGQAQFSMRTYKEEGRDTLQTWLDKAVERKHLSRKEADDLLEEMDRIYKVCEELSESPDYVPFTRWSQATVKRGADNEPLLHVITPNGEYKLNLDVALVCKKRQTLDKVFDRLIKKGVFDNFDMGQEDIANINQIIVRHNFETACAICFVESKRFRQAKLAEDFAEQYNTFLRGMMPEGTEATYFNFGGDPNLDNHNASVTNDVSQLDISELNLNTTYTVEVPDPKNSKKKIPADMTLKQLAEEETSDGKLATRVDNKIARYLLNNAEGRHLLNRTDFIASSGFENVKALSPEVLGLYNSKKGSGGPKSAFGFAQYMHEMLDKRAFNPKAAYAVGGVRIQSFSDFVPRMFFDYAEIVGDLAAKKLPAHAYTKEEAFVKLFGLTGIKINMSLVPASKEGGMAPGLDKDGNYLWEKGQTFDYDIAVEIQQAEGYGDNCGTIAVGVSDMHIRKMLKDKNIRMIIPYHKSSLNPIIAAMNGISDFTDYTDYQNTRYADGTKLDKKDAKKEVNFNVLMHSKHMDPQQAAEAYVRWCEENNYLPRFDQFTYAQDENGEYIVEDGKLKVDENYYKLLEDFTLYNEPSDPNAQRGDYVPQREVKLRLPTDDDAFGSWKSLLTEDQYDENGNRIYQGAFNADAELDAKQEREIDEVVEDIEKNLNTPAVRERISQEQLAERQAHGDELRAAERQRYEEGLAKRRAAVQPSVQYSVKQEYTSEDTSQNQTPSTFTFYKFSPDDRILDWGGGKYDTAKKTMEHTYPGIKFEVVDKFNRTDAHNDRIKAEYKEEPANILTINNVLNVIKEKEAREDLLRESKEYLAPDGVAYILIHPDDGKGNSRVTKASKDPSKSSWQNAQKVDWYLDEVRQFYKYAEPRAGKYIIASDSDEILRPATNDKATGKAIGDYSRSLIKEVGKEKLNMKDSQYSLSFNKNIEDIDPTKPLKTLQGSTIKRAQNNVGKEIGGQIYVHKNYAADTKIPADVLARGEELVPDDFEYNSVMWDKSKPNEIRFDEAPDFDTATEPQVGHFLKINTETGNITAGYSPNIWHHKWLWVKDDYDGFDTREAYDRSQTWLSQVKGTAKGTIKSWNKQLEENGMEPIDSEPVPKNQEFLDRYNSKPKGIFPTKEEADRMNGKTETPKGQPQFSLSNESNKTNEQYQLLFANLGLDLDAKPLKSQPKQSKVNTNTFARTEVFDEAMEFIKDEETKLRAKNAGRRLKENSAYNPIDTQEAMHAAREALIDDYKGEKKRLMSNEAWGSKELHEAMSVACTELSNGNFKEFYKMGLQVKDKGIQGGQLIQAFKIYSKTPEGAAIQVLSQVEDTLGTIPPDIEESVCDLAKELRAIKDGDMDSLIEVIKRQAEIRQTPIGQHTINQLYKETFQANYDRVYAQLMGIEEDARARNPAADSKTFWQKVSTWQLVSHLLNIRTGLRNVTSNVVFGGAETIANNLAWLPDKIISTAMGTGKNTVGWEYLSGDAVRAGFDRARGTAIDVKLDIDTERNRNKYGGTRRTWKMASKSPFAKGMSMAEMVLGYELNVTDEFSKGMHDYRVRRGLEKYVENGSLTQEEADMFAEKEMLYRTFQDDTFPGIILRGIHNGLNWIGFGHTGKYLLGSHFEVKQFGVGDLVQKYTQVPGALLTRLVEYSPAGAAKMIYNLGALHEAQKNLQKEMNRASGERAAQLQQINNDIVSYQREAALSFGRAATGSLLIGLFYALANSGILHDEGSEDDDDTPAGKNAAAIRALQGISGTQLNWSALGRWIDKHDSKIEWQNGDKLINIDFLEPLNGLMSIAAVIAQDEYIVNDDNIGGGEKALLAGQDMIHSIINSFAEVPTMQSIKSIQNAYTYHAKDSKYKVEFEAILELAKGSISGFVPAPMRQAAQFQDDYYRDLYSTRDPVQQIRDAIKNSVPGLRQTLPEKLTPYGAPKEMEDKKTRALNAFVNPGKATTFKESELEHIIADLGSNKLYPEKSAPNKLGFGNKQSLNPDQKRMYQEILGQTYTEEMNKIISTDAFKNATKGEQRDRLTEVKTFADQYAKTQIAEKLDTTYSKSSAVEKTLEAINKGIELPQWIDYKSTVSGLNAKDENGNSVDGLKKERTVWAIDALDISPEAKDYLYLEMQKSNNVKDPNKGLNKTPWHGGNGKFTK